MFRTSTDRARRNPLKRLLRLEGLEQRLLLADDFDDSLNEAVSLGTISTASKTTNASINPDTDVDLYRFTVAANQIIDFDIDTTLNGQGGLGSYLRLFDSTGRQIAFNDDAAAPGENQVGFDAYLRHAFQTAGTHYLGVSNWNNASYNPVTGEQDTTGGQHAIGDYRLIVQGLPIDDDDSLNEATSLGSISTVPDVVDARIDPDIDVDLYRFTVSADQVVEFDIDTAANGPGGLGSFLRIFDAQGQQLAFNNDAAAAGEGQVGFDAYLTHTFATAGAYFVGVSNANNTAYNPVTGNNDTAGGQHSIGDYQLIVRTIPPDPDDTLDEAVTLGTLTDVPEVVDASIDPDIDVDLYAFTVSANRTVDFDIDTPLNGAGGLGSFLRLFDSQGQQLAFSDDAAAPGENDVGFDAYLRRTFAVGGTFYIGVSNTNNRTYDPLTGEDDTSGGPDAAGDYRLILTLLPIDADDSLAEATPLGPFSTAPKVVDARIDPDIDADLFSFTVTANQTVDFDIDTAANGPGGLGSFLRVFDSQGQQLAFNNDAVAPGESQVGFDAYLRHTFIAAGTYYVGVANANNTSYNPATGNQDTAGGLHSIGDYRLIVTRITGEDPVADSLAVTIDRQTMPEFNGSAIGTVTRTAANISQPLTVSLESSDPGEAQVPAQVTIPANETSATFTITAVNDEFVDGAQTVVITAEANGFVDGSDSVQVTDSNSLWHNAERPLDVDDDGDLAPIDALLIINFLNTFGTSPVPSGSPPPFYDVNSDNFIAPIDALMVINGLNAEGEQFQATSLSGPSEANEAAASENSALPPIPFDHDGEDQIAPTAQPSSSFKQSHAAPAGTPALSFGSSSPGTRIEFEAADAFFTELGSQADDSEGIDQPLSPLF